MRLVLDGGTLTGPEEELVQRYLTRLPAPWKPAVECWRKPGRATVPAILLDAGGQSMSTEEFADWLWQLPRNTTFVIGGSHGFVSTWPADSHRLSLSAMTLPHRFAAVLFAEQLYRAYTYKVGHPYHH